jgi:hypothetical protein
MILCQLDKPTQKYIVQLAEISCKYFPFYIHCQNTVEGIFELLSVKYGMQILYISFFRVTTFNRKDVLKLYVVRVHSV